MSDKKTKRVTPKTKAVAALSTAAASHDIHPLAKHLLWLDSDKVKARFIWVLIGLLALITMALFAFPNKHPKPWEPGFVQFISYGLIGAGAVAVIVLCFGVVRRAVVRKENYYGEDVSAPDSSGDDHV